MMLKLSYARNLFIFISLFSLYANSSHIAYAQENQLKFISTGCNVNYDPGTKELKLVEPITANSQSPRARCLIRISTFNTQKQFRLVPLAFKGVISQAPALVTISSALIDSSGIQTSRSIEYSTPLCPSGQFDLTSQIVTSNYTNSGYFGINVVLASSGGEVELTEMRFALQR